MDFLIHVVVTAIALMIISRILGGFEVKNLMAALMAALILGIIHTLADHFADHAGHFVGKMLANAQFSYPVAMAIVILSMLVINTLILLLAARLSPGFQISGFVTAMIGAVLLVAINWLVGEAVDLAQINVSGPSTPPPA